MPILSAANITVVEILKKFSFNTLIMPLIEPVLYYIVEVLASVNEPEKQMMWSPKEEETQQYESQLCHLPAMQLQAKYLISLCLYL